MKYDILFIISLINVILFELLPPHFFLNLLKNLRNIFVVGLESWVLTFINAALRNVFLHMALYLLIWLINLIHLSALSLNPLRT